MIVHNNNLGAVITRIVVVLERIETEKMGREMATSVIGMMRDRIHGKGKASDGSGIGTYSPGYMKVRTGSFRGANYVRGKNKGNPRKKYNRSGSTDVVLSLTREMENDFGIFKNSRGKWAIGFIRNPKRDGGSFTHVKIARNAESNLYGKRIYSLSKDEQSMVDSVLNRYITVAFSNTAP
jgi:hypothetical protein